MVTFLNEELYPDSYKIYSNAKNENKCRKVSVACIPIQNMSIDFVTMETINFDYKFLPNNEVISSYNYIIWYFDFRTLHCLSMMRLGEILR